MSATADGEKQPEDCQQRGPRFGNVRDARAKFEGIEIVQLNVFSPRRTKHVMKVKAKSSRLSRRKGIHKMVGFYVTSGRA